MTSTKSAVEVRRLEKIYAEARGGAAAVADVSFTVGEGEFYTLLGPSGCGKTTTMRCIGGLERIDGGTIAVFGRTVSSVEPPSFVPPNLRGMGMVFQSYAIWPHMSVFDNVSFPLRVARDRPAKAEIANRVAEALALVQLEAYATRMATQLSGGQQQRLALARAIVARPQVLLLDEPLSNLDARLRDDMRRELRAIQKRLGVTTIYVTHDQVEALSMSTRIAVLSAGRIVQEGTPGDLYRRPAHDFVATFLGNSNILTGTVGGRTESGDARVQCGEIALTVPWDDALGAGGSVALTIRPENLVLHVDDPGRANVHAAQIESYTFMGEMAECVLTVNGVTVRARHVPGRAYAPAERVYLEFPVGACAVITSA